jgi:thioredoxin-related protein
MKMKLPLVALATVLALTIAHAADPNWHTDLTAAQAQATKEKKMVLLDFSSSDSCIACVKLKKEVFSQAAFLNYAKTNLVLVEVDFPLRKKLSPEQTQANAALAEKYQVDSYPTIVVLDSAGRKLGVLEDQPGEPQAFIALLEKLKK